MCIRDRVERNENIECYIRKLKKSGYSEAQVRKIIISGLKGYEAKLDRARKLDRDIHRDAVAAKEKKFRKKIMAKTSWFRAKNKDKDED